MSAEILREAAALMRSRAEAATAGPYTAHVQSSCFSHSLDPEQHGPCWGWRISTPGRDYWTGGAARGVGSKAEAAANADADYLASWHPAVALAVADWLDAVAQIARTEAQEGWGHGIATTGALAVARAYLGDP